MALFRLELRDATGRAETRLVAAPDREAAARMARSQGFFVTSIERVARPRQWNPLPGLRTALWPIHPHAHALFFGRLAERIRRGYPLSQALNRIALQMPDLRLRSFAERAAQAAAGGTPLSEVMALDPYTFEAWVCAAVAVAEHAGALEVLLPLLEGEFRTRHRLGRPFVLASFYLRALLVLGVLAATTPLALGRETPGWMPGLTLNAGPLLVALMLVWYLFRFVKAQETLRAIWDHILMALPIAGSLLRDVARLRVLTCFRELIRAGVSPSASFALASAVAGSWWLAWRLRRGANSFLRRQNFGEAFRATGVFPRRIIGLMETASDTGELEPMLDGSCEAYARAARWGAMRAALWTWGFLLLLSPGVIILGFYLGAHGYAEGMLARLDRLFSAWP